eukprot:TRINITY_DN65621_c0_g1_i1.p1 TRINITY_DN65621_c0_g1~~TRINITY_DN65621_c0_g1_i1.p1  ORF type:complete len:811 (+),score=276.14 TRINITY_DN65621_c0_g1_i1:84-2516(+)
MSGCFAGLRIVTVGKLNHSHSYYARVVPRHGGTWSAASVESLREADFVVVPPGALLLAQSHPGIRDACVQALVGARHGCELVLEQFLTDSIHARRRLPFAEVVPLRLVVPQTLRKAWGLENIVSPRAGDSRRELAAPPTQEALEFAAKLEQDMLRLGLRELRENLATNAPAAPRDVPARLCDLQQLDSAPGSGDPGRLVGGVRPAAAAEGGKDEEVAFFESQQAGFNEELSGLVLSTCIANEDAVTELRKRAGEAERLVCKAVEEGPARLDDYDRQYVHAGTVVASADNIEEDWGLQTRTAALGLLFPLRTPPLAPFFNGLAELLEAPTSQARGEQLRLQLAAVWETYCPWRKGQPGPLDDDEALTDPPSERDTYGPHDIATGADLVHGDALAYLKDQCLRPLEGRWDYLVRQAQQADAAYADAFAAADFHQAERHLAGGVAARDALLELCYKREAEVAAGARDTDRYALRLADFQLNARRNIARLRASLEQLAGGVDHDLRTMARRLQTLDQDSAREKEAHGERMAQSAKAITENTRQINSAFAKLNGAVSEIQKLCAARRGMLERSMQLTEAEALRRRRVEAMRVAAAPHERRLNDLQGHTERAMDMVLRADVFCEEVERRGAKRDVRGEHADLAHSEHLRHLDVFRDYCRLAAKLLAAHTARMHTEGLHARGLRLCLQLAGDSLDPGAEAHAQSASAAESEALKLGEAAARLRADVARHTERFRAVEPALEERLPDFVPPYLELEEACAKSEGAALRLISEHIESEQTLHVRLGTQARCAQAKTTHVLKTVMARRAASSPPASPPVP